MLWSCTRYMHRKVNTRVQVFEGCQNTITLHVLEIDEEEMLNRLDIGVTTYLRFSSLSNEQFDEIGERFEDEVRDIIKWCVRYLEASNHGDGLNDTAALCIPSSYHPCTQSLSHHHTPSIMSIRDMNINHIPSIQSILCVKEFTQSQYSEKHKKWIWNPSEPPSHQHPLSPPMSIQQKF